MPRTVGEKLDFEGEVLERGPGIRKTTLTCHLRVRYNLQSPQSGTLEGGMLNYWDAFWGREVLYCPVLDPGSRTTEQYLQRGVQGIVFVLRKCTRDSRARGSGWSPERPRDASKYGLDDVNLMSPQQTRSLPGL